MSGAAPTLQTLRVVWMIMVGGTLFYTLVTYVLLLMGIIDVGSSFGPEVMNYVGAFAVAQIVLSLVVRRRLLAATPPDASPEERMNHYFTACIVALALIEGGGLFVITFSIITGVATWALVGGGAAVVVMVMARPLQNEVEG